MGGVRPIFCTIYFLTYPVPSSAKLHLIALSFLRARCPIHRAAEKDSSRKPAQPRSYWLRIVRCYPCIGPASASGFPAYRVLGNSEGTQRDRAVVFRLQFNCYYLDYSQ
jgi:hypothetical protein